MDRESERAIDVRQGLAEIELTLGDRDAALANMRDAEERAQRSAHVGPRARVKTEFARVRYEIEAGQYDSAAQLLERLIPSCEERLGRQAEDCIIMRRRQVVALIRTGRREAARSAAMQIGRAHV